MSDPSYKWKQSPHTADLAISIEASSREGLFRAAFDGLLGLQGIDTNPPNSGKFHEFNLEIEVDEIENALVDFLSECIYVMEVEEVIPYNIAELTYDGHELIVKMYCRPIRNSEQSDLGHIKAATYSDLKVTEESGIFRATIIFDT